MQSDITALKTSFETSSKAKYKPSVLYDPAIMLLVIYPRNKTHTHTHTHIYIYIFFFLQKEVAVLCLAMSDSLQPHGL